MKKIRVALCALVAVVAFASCHKEPDLTPEEQFKAVVSKQVMDSADVFIGGATDAAHSIDFKNIGSNALVTLTLDDTASRFLAAVCENMMARIDVSWLKSAQFKCNGTVKDDVMQFSIISGINKVDVVTIEWSLDLKNAVAYIRVPELLQKHLKVTDDSAASSFAELFTIYKKEFLLLSTLPEKAVFTGAINEILDALLSSVSDVKSETKTLTAGLDDKTVSAPYTALTLTVTDDMIEAAQKEVSHAISKSKNVRAIFKWLEKVADGYGFDADEVLEEFADSFADALEEIFYEDDTITVYTGSKLSYGGVTASLCDEEVEFECIRPKKGSNFGYSCKFSTYTDFEISGYGAISGDKLSGDYVVNIDSDDAFTFAIKKFDLKSLKKCLWNGTITFALAEELEDGLKDELSDIVDEEFVSLLDKLVLTFSVDQKSPASGTCTLSIGDGGKKSYITLASTSSINKAAPVTLPETDVVDVDDLDTNGIAELLRSVDLAKIVESLKKAGVPDAYVQSLSAVNGDMLAMLFGGYGSSYNSYDDDDDDYDYDYDDDDEDDSDWWSSDDEDDEDEDDDSDSSDYSWLY